MATATLPAQQVQPTAMLVAILKRATELGATDVHLKANLPPMMTLSGKIQAMPDAPVLNAQQVEQILLGGLPQDQVHKFLAHKELDTAITVEGVARFRINVYRNQKTVGSVIRIIPLQIKSMEELGLPSVIKKMALERQGLILVTGPTGSGKTTTLAAIIDYINSNASGHIVTIEDPIEVIHPHKRCLITQREVGDDTDSFANAMKAALRQAPNVILIGEMRDRETIELALKAAETGHLVFSTLHTNDAVQTINRVINAFAPHEQEQIRVQLGNVLKGCVSQRLLPRADGPGRVASIDLMVATATVRDAIIKNHIDQLYEIIANGAFDGMMSANQSLMYHLDNGTIDYPTALSYSENKQDLILLARNAARALKERVG
ncbi:MAG TPA: PilT/PilU family type 4a pilus ATPase [Stenomitos sp.]